MTINWKVVQEDFSFTDFEILSTLGSGGFGTCYEAKYKTTHVCVKKLDRTSKKKAATQSFQAETKEEFFNFSHPNIVKLLAASPANLLSTDAVVADLVMVFEFIEGRNLQSLLDDHEEDIGASEMLRFGHEIASALDYVNGFHIAHLDLKPANVMVTPDGLCKLADFGCSQYIEEDPVTPTRSCLTGTFAYRAPELLRGGSPSAKCDVYALGICLWQFWSREFPFSGMQQHAVIFRVVKSNLRPEFNKDKPIDPSYKDLTTRCWSADPCARPSLQEVMETLTFMKDPTDLHR
ncbi:serine/threonine-protein kinase mos-like isoform X1 [Hydractinia symbiolongicarpus]|uniref:serine/threonine-protein kinase mos-like isoform X1 n=1 Tax=Hydractinia symbiolongicarpus TaxID=13093 RepID=UPI00254E81E8|nr:serine/threonine-protein kinase mos-like isoform X1 [Hydractinia symbiolongicarpus]